MKKKLIFVFVILIAMLPPLYLLLIWNSIPESVPVHFNFQMEPDRFGNKNELVVLTLVMSLISLLLFFFFRNIHRFDPKRKDQPSGSFSKLAAGLVVFINSLSFLILLSAIREAPFIQNLLFPFMGLLFAFLGNYMVHIKPNYFAGFRLPWTLHDNDNWRRTHQLGGKLWFWSGMAFAILSLFLAKSIIVPVFIGMVVIITLIPAIYSYRIFRQKS